MYKSLFATLLFTIFISTSSPLTYLWEKIDNFYSQNFLPVPTLNVERPTHCWKHKKIGWCGTSIPAGAGATGLHGYVSILAKTLDCKIDNQSANSSGMVWAGNREPTLGATIIELQTANFDTIESYEHKLIDKEYDILVIDHGFNDRDYVIGNINDATSTTYYGAMNRMMTALLRNNPRLSIILTTPPSLYTPYQPGSGTGKLNLHTVAIRQANLLLARKWGTNVCDLSYLSGINKHTVGHDMPDGIHPGDSTHIRLALVLYKFMNNLKLPDSDRQKD